MPLKVIGAGLPRTGTLSLKFALQELGFGPCHHMSEIFMRPGQVTLWTRKLSGEPVGWDEVLEGYSSTTDAPSCFVYRELMAHYPEAKVILSVRSAESWWSSAQATVMSPQSPANRPEILPNSEDFARMFQTMRTATGYDVTFDTSDSAGSIASFERHNEEVKRVVPKERLLVFEAKQGWEPLCSFLGVPLPNTPYPHLNSTGEFQQNLARIAGG
jgi:hypothetical protein